MIVLSNSELLNMQWCCSLFDVTLADIKAMNNEVRAKKSHSEVHISVGDLSALHFSVAERLK